MLIVHRFHPVTPSRQARALLSAIFALGVSATGVAGCESEDSESDPVALELASETWSASDFVLTLSDSPLAIERIDFDGFGCTSELTPAGTPVCDSLLYGPIEQRITLDPTSPTFEWTSGFGLTLTGALVETDGDAVFAGTYEYTADNGCCSSAGEWTALPAATEGGGDSDACTQPTGDETVAVGITTEDGGFAAVEDGDTVTAVPGLQGAIMIVAGVQGQGFGPTGLRATLSVEFESGDVTGDIATETSPFDPVEVGSEWLDAWLVLNGDAGEALSPFKAQDRSAVDGQIATISVQVSNECGLDLSAEAKVLVVYAP